MTIFHMKEREVEREGLDWVFLLEKKSEAIVGRAQATRREVHSVHTD